MSEREAGNKVEKGSRKYREWIHKESKYADTHKNLDFKFSKPRKEKARNKSVECENCGRELFITEDTIAVICSDCKHLNSLRKKG